MENKIDFIFGGKVLELCDRIEYIVKVEKVFVFREWIFFLLWVICESWGLKCEGFREGEVISIGLFIEIRIFWKRVLKN